MKHLSLILLTACAPRLYSEDAVFDPNSGNQQGVPENQWPGEEPPENLGTEGFFVGQVLPSVYLDDQNGDSVWSHQFHGNLTLIDISTMWCAPCQELAEGAAETAELYAEYGFNYVTVLHQDVHGDDPGPDKAQAWADMFHIDHSPVLVDPQGTRGTKDGIPNGQYPQLYLVGPDLTIIEHIPTPSDSAVRASVNAFYGIEE